jgi:hypothetical protein
MVLYRAIYLSRCLLPADPAAFAEGVNNILRWSREWNTRTGTTGALLCNAGHFAQVLEGPADAVKATVGFITCDPRSLSLQLLERGYVDQRAFPNWSMAYVDGANQPDITLVGIKGALDEPSGPAILSMLRWLIDDPASKKRE